MIKLLVLFLVVAGCESQRVMLVNTFKKEKSTQQSFSDYLDNKFKPNINIEKVFNVESNKCLGREEYGHRVFVCDFKNDVLVFSLHSGRIKKWEIKLDKKKNDSQSDAMKLHQEVITNLEKIFGASRVDVMESGKGFKKVQKKITQN